MLSSQEVHFGLNVFEFVNFIPSSRFACLSNFFFLQFSNKQNRLCTTENNVLMQMCGK